MQRTSLFSQSAMESGFLTFILVSFFSVYSSHTGVTDWDDVMVAREGMPTTLVCTDASASGAVAVNWMVKTPSSDEWKLVLSVSERKKFSGGASKASMRLIDPKFQDTGVFSLSFLPKMEDSGLYSCLIKQQEWNVKERIILLAILTVTVAPAAPVLQYSTLRLIARVSPDFAAAKITWTAPWGLQLKSERKPNKGTVAKVPQVQASDDGAYICMVQPAGNSSSSLFAFNVDVFVDANNVASFTNITHEPIISTATQAHTSLTLACPVVQGDYVLLYWQPPDVKKSNMKMVYQYDRWRSTPPLPEQKKKFQLAGPPYNAEAGSFSFILAPGLRDGGLFICEVFLDDVAFSQRTRLSVLKVKTSLSSSKLELVCLYTERSQVKRARWKYQDESRQLRQISKGPGSITVVLPVPITSDTAGNYTCSLQLTNGQTIWATQAVAMPTEESVSVTPRSLPPSLSALLLLVPLVAATVCVLLWKQKHISDRGIEQSLSVHSGDTENIYENPESLRQAPLEGSVYMDLKPRGEDDVYKELELYEHCQS